MAALRRAAAEAEFRREISELIARSALGAPVDLARLENELAVWQPDESEVAGLLGLSLTPIPGGYCVRTLDENRCLDVVEEFYSVLLRVTHRDTGTPHTGYDSPGRSWRFYASGHTDAGAERTKRTAFVTALYAAEQWDGGAGDPPHFDKALPD